MEYLFAMTGMLLWPMTAHCWETQCWGHIAQVTVFRDIVMFSIKEKVSLDLAPKHTLPPG